MFSKLDICQALLCDKSGPWLPVGILPSLVLETTNKDNQWHTLLMGDMSFRHSVSSVRALRKLQQ